MRGRRDAIRLVVRVARQLHLIDSGFDPTIDIILPAGASSDRRPLTDTEEMLGRLAADGTLFHTRLPAAWAIGQASGVAGELVQATIADVHLSDATICLRGNGNREPRIGTLTEWGVEKLAERIAHLREDGGGVDTPLIRGPKAADRSAQAESCSAISDVLRQAGLRDVKPMSLANWAGRQVFDQTGRIEAAARTLGLRSPDLAAKNIGWDWR